MIQFSPTDDERQLQELAREFAQRRMRPALRDAEAAGGAPAEVAREFHELGLAAIGIPEAAGGLGLGLVAQALVWEELAAGDLGLALALPGPGMALPFLATLATPDQQRMYLAPFASEGGAPGADGSPRRAALATAGLVPDAEGPLGLPRARPTDQGYVLDGALPMVTPAPADLYLVPAALEGAAGPPPWAAFAIPGDAAGLSVSAPVAKVGLEAVPTAHLTLEECHVESRQLLGLDAPPGALQRALDAVRVLCAAQAVGLARAAAEYAARYAAGRKAFGQPIAQFQAIAFLAAEMAMEVEAARALTWRAAWLWDTGKDAAVAAAQALMQASQAAMFCTDNAVQTLGGHGYVDDHPVEKWMRDAKAHMVLNPGGTNEGLSARVAASAIGPVRTVLEEVQA